MRSSKWLLPPALMLLVACAAKTGPDFPTEKSYGLPNNDEQQRFMVEPPIAGHTESPTPWPADSVEGVHGWVAIGSGTADNPPPWGAIQASHPTVILDDNWTVPEDTTLYGLAVAGRAPLVTQPKETATFGCDGGHPIPNVTPLQGEAPAGLVWVVSPTFKHSFDPVRLTVKTVDEENVRTWYAGTHVVGLTKTATYSAKLWHGAPSQVIAQYDLSKNLMEGFDPEPVNIQGDFLIPQVIDAWLVGNVIVMGLYTYSFEGVHFQALVLNGPQAGLTEVGSLYNCAF